MIYIIHYIWSADPYHLKPMYGSEDERAGGGTGDVDDEVGAGQLQPGLEGQ